MHKIIGSFLDRNLPDFKENIFFIEAEEIGKDYFIVTANDNKVFIKANNFVSFCNGLYSYLKKFCNVQLSWCGNREIKIDCLKMFDGEYKKIIDQKYRVYLNYCTFDYSMCWWNFDRWEKEIDFMAMNGINMPLCVVGTEKIWFETMKQFGLTTDEALKSVSGPSFWAWQLMTNIDSYLPPFSENYIEERYELGKKIIERYIEFGMQPIQQGFAGHVPIIFKQKYKNSKIIAKKGWCKYPKTGQIDPLDPLFTQVGLAYLTNMEKYFGNYHYIACDPFHEGVPPKKSKKYLSRVGETINKMYESFDKDSVWVMQGWTPYEYIMKQVPIGRLLILDLNSECYKKFDNFYGHEVVAGMLHNFGGKNAMQGHIKMHCDNCYLKLKHDGVNVVGSGMFMEGIEQNPIVYDLQFNMLTQNSKIDFEQWLNDYICRRYGKYNEKLKSAWNIMLDTCYSDNGYNENEVGSMVASRPEIMPKLTGPCCFTNIWYDTKKLEKALLLFYNVSKEYSSSDGYQYDLCDLTRQVLSNRFHDNQIIFEKAYKNNNVDLIRDIANKQLSILLDMDNLLSHRSELCFSRYICDCHNLATSEEEKRYFDYNARTLVTLWGNINGNCAFLYDYAWREWCGMIKDYYYVRWNMFYSEIICHLEKRKKLKIKKCDSYNHRNRYKSFPFGKKLNEFELDFCKNYKDYEYPVDTDVCECVSSLIDKWNIG